MKRRDPRGDRQCAAGDARARAAGHHQGLWRFVGRLPRAVLDRGLRYRSHSAATRCAPTSGTSSAAHNIEIPWPIQIAVRRATKNRSGREQHVDDCGRRTWPSIDLFKTLSPRSAPRAAHEPASHHLFAPGEAIVRQDAEGDSMFVSDEGQARVVLEPSGQEVAVIPAGGFFGEMSMLTGDPRTATVRRSVTSRCWKFAAKDFRELALAQSGSLLDHISTDGHVRGGSGSKTHGRQPDGCRRCAGGEGRISSRECAASSTPAGVIYSAQIEHAAFAPPRDVDDDAGAVLLDVLDAERHAAIVPPLLVGADADRARTSSATARTAS